MENPSLKAKRAFGYDLIINTFEPFLRNFLANEVLLVNYGNEWLSNIPKGVITELQQFKQINSFEGLSIDDFFDELTLLNLKDIALAFNNYKLSRSFFGALDKVNFNELMDDLNDLRTKIAHAKSAFSELDLNNTINIIRNLAQGEEAKQILVYIEDEGYKNASEIPFDFFEEYEIPNNLPPESYDLEGGFVGRAKEIKGIQNFIKSEQDRVITITGAGGVGKTAIALRIAYLFLTDKQNPFSAILWFSAKVNKLTEEGIVPLSPGIKSHKQLLNDILGVLDQKTLVSFEKAKVPIESYVNFLNDFFKNHKCLLIIDNLETIIKDSNLMQFIVEIPRPSQVLITSRKGLGEFERRYPLTDMLEKDAIVLFRIVAKEKNRIDLLKLSDNTILERVKSVRCYPLLIKWAIGQVCLGKDIDAAFSQILSGDSEIAKFAFNDVFILLSENAKSILYSMVVYNEKAVSKYALMVLANLDSEQADDAIKELSITSFVYPTTRDTVSGPITEYTMLELTRGFIEDKLDDNGSMRQNLLTRLYDLSQQVRDFEKSKNVFSQSMYTLGIKTLEEQVAFNYVKAAKNLYLNGDVESAEKNYELATKAAPQMSYVLTEYSKFKFMRGHIPEAVRMAEKAVNCNPQSFHAWFNYAITLEKVGRYQDSKNCLLKAKELNPHHLPIFTELGRVLMILGDYEKAEKEFSDALEDEKYPNYRHKTITLYCKAENYKHWAETFGARRDVEGKIMMLEQALDTATQAFEITPKDRRTMRLFFQINIDLGRTYERKEGFERAKLYFSKCLKPYPLGNAYVIPDDEIVSNAYYCLAVYGSKKNNVPQDQIANWIRQGLSASRTGKSYNKLMDLKQRLEQVDPNLPREYGKIKFFNLQKSYGVIDSSDKSYLFFGNAFHPEAQIDDLSKLANKSVSFKLIKGRKGENDLIAVDVMFEE